MTRTTDPRLSIRAATRVDVPTLVGLMSEFYAEAGFSLATDPAANAFSTLLTTPVLGRVWLAEVDGRGVGHLVLTIAFSMEFGGLRGFVDEFQASVGGIIDKVMNSSSEFERVARQGAISPDLWMIGATGKPVGAQPLLDATARALAR